VKYFIQPEIMSAIASILVCAVNLKLWIYLLTRVWRHCEKNVNFLSCPAPL